MGNFGIVSKPGKARVFIFDGNLNRIDITDGFLFARIKTFSNDFPGKDFIPVQGKTLEQACKNGAFSGTVLESKVANKKRHRIPSADYR
jgi:hypothetical protein